MFKGVRNQSNFADFILVYLLLTWNILPFFSGVSIFDFEHVFVCTGVLNYRE